MNPKIVLSLHSIVLLALSLVNSVSNRLLGTPGVELNILGLLCALSKPLYHRPAVR